MNHVLVTGSKGFLGQQLVNYLTTQPDQRISQIDLPEFDLTQPAVFDHGEFDDFDVVFLAHAVNPTQDSLTPINAGSSLERSFSVNVLSISLLLEHIATKLINRSRPIKIIHLSSIYSVKSPKHYLYNSTLKPAAYGATKAAANYLIKHYSLLYPTLICGVNLIIGGVLSGREEPEFVSAYSYHAPTRSMINPRSLIPVIVQTSNYLTELSAGSDIYLDGGWSQW